MTQSLILNPNGRREKIAQDKTKTLYGVMFEVRKHGNWHAREEYLHAEDLPDARFRWAAGIPRNYKLGFNVHLVGIAPVVGVHVDEEKQMFYV